MCSLRRGGGRESGTPRPTAAELDFGGVALLARVKPSPDVNLETRSESSATFRKFSGSRERDRQEIPTRKVLMWVKSVAVAKAIETPVSCVLLSAVTDKVLVIV